MSKAAGRHFEVRGKYEYTDINLRPMTNSARKMVRSSEAAGRARQGRHAKCEVINGVQDLTLTSELSNWCIQHEILIAVDMVNSILMFECM